MEIEEPERLKKETEAKILKLLSEFESTTNLGINDISLEHISPVVLPRFVNRVKLECLLR